MRAEINMGTLIHLAQGAGMDMSPWRAKADVVGFGVGDATKLPGAANDAAFDPSAFDVRGRWHHIPPRHWIMKPALVAGHFSMMLATGASGKTALLAKMAVGLATGRHDITGYWIDRPFRVVFISGEDGADELMRRTRAECQASGVDVGDIGDRLLMIGAGEVPGLTFSRVTPNGVEVDEDGLAKLAEIRGSHRADVVMIDPLGSFLPGGLNDGASASAVAGRITQMCVAHDCAVMLAHHTGKVAIRTGDASASAGLGSMMWTNHARCVINLSRPTVDQAASVGAPPSAVRDMVLVDHTKLNLAPADDVRWVKMVGVALNNAQPPRWPDGDVVGVATWYTPQSAACMFPLSTLKSALDQIELRATTGSPYKPTGRAGSQDYRPDLAQVLLADFPSDSIEARQKLAVKLVDHLRAVGWVDTAPATMPRAGGGKGGGKAGEVLTVNWDNTPWGAGQE